MPGPTPTELLTAVRNELVTAELVRRASETEPDAPPMHVAPLEGAPAPGADEIEPPGDDPELVITLRHSTDFAEGRGDTYRRRSVLDLIYRAAPGPSPGANLQRVYALDALIVERLVAREDYALGWLMGADGAFPGVLVLESTLYSGIGLVESSREQGWHLVTKLLLEVQRAD